MEKLTFVEIEKLKRGQSITLKLASPLPNARSTVYHYMKRYGGKYTTVIDRSTNTITITKEK